MIVNNWFKYYIDWVKHIRPIPDTNMRLALYDMIMDVILSLMDGKEYKKPDNIPSALIGVADNMIETIKTDYQKLIEEKEKKSKARKNYWDKQKMNIQEDEETEEKEKNELDNFLKQFSPQTRIYIKWLTKLQNEKKEYKKEIIEFLNTNINDIPCVNSYFAWAIVFSEYYSSKGEKPHGDEKEARDHFHKWWYSLKESGRERHKIKHREYLSILAKLYPEGKGNITKM